MFLQQPIQRSPRREAERLKTLAESLAENGKYKGNEMVSGQIVKQSPWEHLARGLQTAAGGYFAGQSQNKAEEDEQILQKRIADALGQWGANPQEAAALLAQDPRTSDMAMKLMGGEIDYSRQRQRQMEEDALARERIQALGASGGGNMPAPMKIASKMFELEQIMNNPAVPEDQRFLAQREYNLLGQTAKTYGFDRGVQASPMGGYGSVFGGQDEFGGIPQVDLNAPVPQGQTPATPMTPSQFPPVQGANTQDPLAEHAQAVQRQQGQVGMNPYQRQELRQPMTMTEIPGYGDAAAGIAAKKKMAEAEAAEIGKRRGEAGGTLEFLDANMPKLEEVVNRLDRLSNTATYTAAGRGLDALNRELGRPSGEGAIARAEYIATVDNEVLPLLRDTFGAAFTVKEGETLRATLGDANKSPQEKKAVLNAFINQKKAQVKALQRQVGQAPQPQGQIAVNPQTGERLINRGNGWEPMQ